MKNLYIKTFGCQMNEYDSKKIAHILYPLGYKINDDIEDADLIILNTCSIRQKAEDKVYSLLGRLRPYKDKNGSLIIAVGGCVAQQEGKKILSKNRHINLVFGTKNVLNLPNMIEKILKEGKRYVDVDEIKVDERSFGKVIDYYKKDPKAFVTIIEGCDNFCSYCIVPYVRGRERSRPAERIIKETKTLVKNGVKEITLLGQNVNSYYDNNVSRTDFPKLLRKVASIDGLKRLRFVTSHPKDLTDELIGCFGEIDNLCNHIHLPVQSGSDKILQMMNRKYTVKDYLSKVDKLKKVCNNINISTDIIVGFPGETKNDFQKTIELVKRIKYDSSFSFKYSKRSGTKAAEFSDNTDNQEKSLRLHELQSLQKEITLGKNKNLEGNIMEVLVEGESKTNPKRLTGRTRCNRVVNFSVNNGFVISDLIGNIVKVKIIKGYINSLKGEIEK